MGLCVTLKYDEDCIVIEGVIVIRVRHRLGKHAGLLVDAPRDFHVERIHGEPDNERARSEYRKRNQQSKVGV